MRHQSRALVFTSVFLLVALSVPSKATDSKSKVSIASFAKYTQIPGAKQAGPDACASCHDLVSKNFQHAFHAQQGVECEQCHGPASLHIDGAGDVSKIVAFSKRSPEQANGVCLSCHVQSDNTRHWISGSHAANHVRCIDCHQIHQAAFRTAKERRIPFDQATRGALVAASVSPETNVIVRPAWETHQACLKCHQTQNAQMSMPYHHPLREGKVSCVDCHDPHGGPRGNNLRTSNVNDLCLKCHAQYRGPYAYQHPPVTENCMLCHTRHGSPNTNLLTVSEPALCLQCHAGHHNGAGTPLADRCTNCHGSIHGTDVPTPSGGSRFVDKGPTEQQLKSGTFSAALAVAHAATAIAVTTHGPSSRIPAFAAGGTAGLMGMMSSRSVAPLAGGIAAGSSAFPGAESEASGPAAFSFTPGSYRFVDGSGYLGRVGEYDTLQQSAGADFSGTFVSPQSHITIASRANVLTGDDYAIATQLTAGERLQVGLFVRSFMQQQDHYNFYAFPFLDLPPGTPTPCDPATTCVDSTTDSISSRAVFGVKRRLGNAYARGQVPNLPVHWFIKGDWQARVGTTQLAYLDENIGATADTCGEQCHFASRLQSLNFTTRNIGGGAQVDLGQFHFTWEHTFSSFNDRLLFPVASFGGFFPEVEGVIPPSGPAAPDVPAGNYALDIPAPSQYSSDRVGLNWTASPNLIFNGNISYTRLHDTYTHYPQNSFGTDETLTWRPVDRFRVIADYHQQNVLNDFTPYYSVYGNVSYHRHDAGVRFDYQLPKGLDAEVYYKRGGITRSNASLWPQVFSFDNTDLLTVVPSTTSNTAGLALRYHDSYWSGRAGYEWTDTHHPGYLIVPQSDNRAFADVWLTPKPWFSVGNELSVTIQNAFPAIPLLRPSDGTGLPGDFQRRNRFYLETLSANFRPVPEWNLGLGYSYQQNNLDTYMAFQNDSGVAYVVNEPKVPYRQITQAYWAESSYLAKQRFGVNLRITYNSSRSSMRPDVNAADAALLGNSTLISQDAFDPVMFGAALNNLQFSATQISGVIVPQWIGQGKAYYLFPHKFEGGLNMYYGSYRDYWNPNLNGVLRTFNIYVGRSW